MEEGVVVVVVLGWVRRGSSFRGRVGGLGGFLARISAEFALAGRVSLASTKSSMLSSERLERWRVCLRVVASWSARLMISAYETVPPVVGTT